MFGLTPLLSALLGGVAAIALVIGVEEIRLHDVRVERDALQTQHDLEFAASTQALVTGMKDQVAKIKSDTTKAVAAAETATKTLTDGQAGIEGDRNRALAQLAAEKAAKEKAETDATKMLNVISMPACGWTGVTRRLLDQASGSTPGGAAAAGSAEAGAAGEVARADPAAAQAPDFLTCDQLARGYVALGSWGRDVMSRAKAWQDWYRVRFP